MWHETVDALLDLDEGPELGEVSDLAGDLGADRVLLGQLLPGVRLDLLQPEADAVRLLIDSENLALDFLVHRQDLGGMLDLLGPGHLGDVDEPLDTLLQLHEGAVVGEAHHPALDPCRHRILDRGCRPGIGLQLLHAQGNTLGPHGRT